MAPKKITKESKSLKKAETLEVQNLLEVPQAETENTVKEEETSEKVVTNETQNTEQSTERKTIKIIKPEPEDRFSKSSLLLSKIIVHSRRVENFCDALFKALLPVHELPSEYNKILCLAAQLHDLGWIYGQSSHHKASADIIYNFVKKGKFIPAGDSIDTYLQDEINALLRKKLEGIDKKTARLIACVARYHRKSEPSPRHSIYKKLSKREQKIVTKLASIIRIADALDFSHMALVKSVKVKIEEKTILLTLNCDSSCVAEKERVGVKKQLFQDTFKRVLECKVDNK